MGYTEGSSTSIRTLSILAKDGGHEGRTNTSEKLENLYDRESYRGFGEGDMVAREGIRVLDSFPWME